MNQCMVDSCRIFRVTCTTNYAMTAPFAHQGRNGEPMQEHVEIPIGLQFGEVSFRRYTSSGGSERAFEVFSASSGRCPSANVYRNDPLLTDHMH